MDIFRLLNKREVGRSQPASQLWGCGCPCCASILYFFALLLVQLLHSVSVLRHTALPELPTLWCGGLELSAFELKELSHRVGVGRMLCFFLRMSWEVWIMSKLKHSEGMIYLGANFMPDCRSGHFQIDDVLNLFFRSNTNLRIRSDGYSVFFLKTPLHKQDS